MVATVVIAAGVITIYYHRDRVERFRQHPANIRPTPPHPASSKTA